MNILTESFTHSKQWGITCYPWEICTDALCPMVGEHKELSIVAKYFRSLPSHKTLDRNTGYNRTPVWILSGGPPSWLGRRLAGRGEEQRSSVLLFKGPPPLSPSSLPAYQLFKTLNRANLLTDDLEINGSLWNLISNCLNLIQAIKYFQCLKWTRASAFQVVGAQKTPLLVFQVSRTEASTFLCCLVCGLSSLAGRLRGKTTTLSWRGGKTQIL